jgi:glycosyltransferase involved in cell wall biosynthesis
MSVALYFFNIVSAGGAERMICRLANDLSMQGCRVTLISLDPQDATSYYPLLPAVNWVRLGREGGWCGKFRRVRNLCKVFKDSRTDVLIGFVMSGDKTVYAAAKLSGVKLIAAERNAPAMYFLRYGWVTRWVSFLLLHLTDRIVVQFSEYINSYPVTLRRRMVAIANPVDFSHQQAHPGQADSNGRFKILAVGRLDDVQKRVSILVDAFAKIADTHETWDMVILGDGPERKALSDLIGRYGLEERCTIEPMRQDVFSLYTQSHLFAMPSLWEGFPNALAEALSHGLPAVGFAGAPGVSHLIAACGGGWLAKGAIHANALAGVLDDAMRDPKERVRRGELARRGMAQYDPTGQFALWQSLINGVVGDVR